MATSTRKLLIPDPNNPFREEVLYGQPVSSATAPTEFWQGLLWHDSVNNELKFRIGDSWLGQTIVDWNQTNPNRFDFIKNKPSSFTPSAHTHGNITNAGFLGSTGDLALYTTSESGLAGKIIAGVLPAVCGGTGLSTITKNDVLVGGDNNTLTKLTAAAGALYFNGTDVVFGTLPVNRGGTGKDSFTANRLLYSGVGGAISELAFNTGVPYYKDSTLSFNIPPVSVGGTGKTSFVANSVLIGQGELDNLSSVTSVSGALFSTGAGVAPSFGTLPVLQGGTGRTTLTDLVTDLGVLSLSGGTMTGTLTAKEINISSGYTLKLNNTTTLSLNSTNIEVGSSSVDTLIRRAKFYNGTTSYDIFHKGNITYGTGDPPSSGMSAGDIYIQY